MHGMKLTANAVHFGHDECLSIEVSILLATLYTTMNIHREKQQAMTNRRGMLRLLSVGGAGAIAGCMSSDSGGKYDIGMSAVAFKPVEISITAGETIRWQNTSSRGHTITAYEDQIPAEAEYFASGGFKTEKRAREAFHSEFGGIIDSGDWWTHTFEIPGTYGYVCIPHEASNMVGTITVESSG
jgi:plastocyanin